MSPIVLALLELLAYKAFKGRGDQTGALIVLIVWGMFAPCTSGSA